MRILHFDCISGAAGDMLLAALLDAGAAEVDVRLALDGLRIPGWELVVAPVARSGLRALHIEVSSNDAAATRTYREVRALLEGADLEEGVRRRSLDTFARLAGAEAKVHDQSPDDVHFHEVGGIDALIDVVGCAAALESLKPERITSSGLVTGRGWTSSAHGELPVPAPAVLELLSGVPLAERGDQELVTPTGAAILTACVDSFGTMPAMEVGAVGYGAGTRELSWPNVVRVIVGNEVPSGGQTDAWLIECNVDDMSPELIPHAIQSLIEAGASDAWTTPIVMKKGRPALTLSVLVADDSKERALDVIYRETTTLGVRFQTVIKDELDREWVETEILGQPVKVKLGRRGGRVTTVAPEYEDALKAARATGLPLREVFDRAKRAAQAVLANRS